MQISTGIHRTCMIYKTCPQTCPFLELATNDFDAHTHSSIKLLKKGRGEHITQHLLFARQVEPMEHSNMFKNLEDFLSKLGWSDQHILLPINPNDFLRFKKIYTNCSKTQVLNFRTICVNLCTRSNLVSLHIVGWFVTNCVDLTKNNL